MEKMKGSVVYMYVHMLTKTDLRVEGGHRDHDTGEYERIKILVVKPTQMRASRQ